MGKPVREQVLGHEKVHLQKGVWELGRVRGTLRPETSRNESHRAWPTEADSTP